MSQAFTFTREARQQLAKILGAAATTTIRQLERLAGDYDPKWAAPFRGCDRRILAELARLDTLLLGLLGFLDGCHDGTIVGNSLKEALLPEVSDATLWDQLQRFRARAVSSRAVYAEGIARQPRGRPRDESWLEVCLNVADTLERASIRATTAPPQGHHPRGAKLWRVLDVMSYEVRDKPVGRRDVEWAARTIAELKRTEGWKKRFQPVLTTPVQSVH